MSALQMVGWLWLILGLVPLAGYFSYLGWKEVYYRIWEDPHDSQTMKVIWVLGLLATPVVFWVVWYLVNLPLE